ncbi:helix-turn-helix transcriptional regulator [Mesobacterium pallidum]|uniref:helix-turn-helix transcriptional regulator n=1 Tax=Mesobacterium pallidum TaxID=2872037 RepID=UPI001EE1D1A3|nr:autoinducer binding domain-containing protein [Mesobacterium pallidum]
MGRGEEQRRPVVDAECYTPPLLRDFLLDLERTRRSVEVWRLIVQLGRELNLPFIDFISTNSLSQWRRTQFIRTSYDSSWLTEVNKDPELYKWSYFRSHALHYLTPVMIGLEFVDEYRHIPAKRVEVLREAAERGIRAGFSVPLRYNTPPQAALITFSGDHSKREMTAIVKAHGWTLHTAAVMGHQRYMYHFAQEFSERNHISDKQKELLGLLGHGLQDKVIAERLGISISAVRQRMNLLMQKTNLSNRAELAALAMSIGLVPDPVHRPSEVVGETLIEMDDLGSKRR